MFRTRRSLLALIAAFAFAFAAPLILPAQDAAPSDKSQEKKPDAQRHAGAASRDEFALTIAGNSLEYDPRKSYSADEAQVFTALYEGLFSYHPISLEPVPGVAERWQVSDDKLTWTFHLREEARYWNGDPVVASNFRDSWISLIDPKNNAPYSSLFDLIDGAKEYRLGKVKDMTKVGISAPDAHTLIVRLSAPADFFPRVLCHHCFSPVNPRQLGDQDFSKSIPISNGPYYILEKKKDRIVLTKNELYWDAASIEINRIVLRFCDDGKEAASLWDTGAVQWISGDVDLDSLKDRSGISVNPMFATHYYYIRSSKAPWTDRRLRRALSIALPWDKIRDGQLLPAATLIYPVPGYPKVDGQATANLEDAKKLLADAGFPKGVGAPPVTIRITPSEDAKRISALMKSTWEGELGLQVKIDIVPFDDYYAALRKDDYDVGSTTWIGDFADPFTFLQMWQADSNLNDAHYNDSEYEGIMAKSMKESGEARWKTLAEAEKLLLDGGTVLPISYAPALNIIDTEEIDGWYPNPLDIHPFKYLSYAAWRALPGVALEPGKKSGLN